MSHCDECEAELDWCNTLQRYVNGYRVDGETLLCEACLDASPDIEPISVPLPPHPSDWMFVVYPAHTQSDMFCSTTHRFVTSTLESIGPWLSSTQSPNTRFSYGILMDGIPECHEDVILHAFRHGGPNEDGHATMTLAFARYVWREWPRLPIRIRRARCPTWSAEICASDAAYTCEDDFVNAISNLVGNGWWFAGHTRDSVSVSCLVPSIVAWKAFSNPASVVDIWYDSLDALQQAVTCDPKLRDCIEDTFYRFKTEGE